jgi:AAA family ATP:ADP antiporter
MPRRLDKSVSPTTPSPSAPPLGATMACAGVVTAQFIAAKAARDALYLAHLDVTSLPAMVIVTSIVSLVLVVLSAKCLKKIPPSTFVPLLFILSAVLQLIEWQVTLFAPTLGARIVYLQISGLGPLLGSGFWLIATERFDPHTAKKRFGQILGMGTLGGLLGGLLAERVAAVFDVTAMLPVLAALNFLGAWQIRQLAGPVEPSSSRRAMEMSPELAPDPASSGLRAMSHAPYLRNLAALVLLGTTSVTFVDYIFKAQAVEVFGRGDTLLRFFAAYYAATSLLTFVVQTAASRVALERLGLAASAGSPSAALLVGSLGALLVPGLQSALMARGGEAVLRGSLFRSGYELFYTPIGSDEKRAAKSIIDVGFDRAGDAVGGGIIRLLLMLPATLQYSAILYFSIGCSALTLLVASRLNRGYLQTLERSLLNRAVELDLSDIEDLTTRTVVLRTLVSKRPKAAGEALAAAADRPPSSLVRPALVDGVDPELQEIIALRSKDKAQIMRVLNNDEGLPGSLVPHVIPLLAWDPVADTAVHALRKVAEERVGELIDALVDPNQPFAIRRRLARVFSVCVSQRAADGVMIGLEDMRFEVRFQCGRSLASILEKNPRVHIDKARTFEVVRREVAVGRPVWESHRLLDRLDDQEQRSFVDEFLKDRANQSLAHVFTLLSLVLPTEPLRIAFRGLHTDNQSLRGTALEYLEGVLPPEIRERLWPFLDDQRSRGRENRPREDILADLMRSHLSIMLNLEELQQRAKDATNAEPAEPKK